MHCSISTFSTFAPRWPRVLVIGLLIGLVLHSSACLPTTPASDWYVAPILHTRPKRKPVWRWHLRRPARGLHSPSGWRALLARALLRTALLALLLCASGWTLSTPLSGLVLLMPLAQTLNLGVLRAGHERDLLIQQRCCAGLQRLYQLSLLCLLVSTVLRILDGLNTWPLLGLWLLQGDEHAIEVEPRVEHTYQVSLRGAFQLLWQPRDSFERWLLILFLRRLQPLGQAQPWLTQTQVAEAFGTTDCEVSRWEKRVRQHGWHMLSDRYRRQLHSALPAAELSRAILGVWVPTFWLSAWEVRERLITLGVIADRHVLTLEALHQLAHHTGFAQVRQLLLARFQLQDGQLIADEHWWLRELLALNARLIQQLERGERLSPQQLIALEPLRLKTPENLLNGAPVVAVLQTALVPSPQPTAPELTRCTYCGSTDVSPKSAQPRLKRLIDQCGVEHWIAVLRYYCHNPTCHYQSFTALPAGVWPHSPYPVHMRLLALDLYVNLLSTYRRSARLLNVQASTVYQWLADLSPAALHLAAYLGVVRTSGVVGIDDKWIKVCSPSAVPKHGTHKRAVWRYAYFAVDVYSLDLLALELYPEHNDHAVRLLLLALKARGLQPRVVVTDLDPAYARMLPEVFPRAVHHECIFHALQNAQRQLTQVYGKHYRETIPNAAALHEQVLKLFRARTQKTVRARFAELLALREAYVTETPAVACVFDSLETHFPKLVNAIESPCIPRTNNATELVIRRFDQHYAGMGGFDTFESAKIYLRLFTLVYRLTPFADDNPNEHIRGRCPLELAGYDLTTLPIGQFFIQRQLPVPMLPVPERCP